MSASPERVVLDTNVLLSAVLFDGRPEELLEHVRAGRIRGVASLHILDEFRRVLTRPRFGLSSELAEDLVAEIATFVEVVAVEPSPTQWTNDPADDPVVETALQGHAEAIITGDRRLLGAVVPGVRIVTVAEMLEELSAD